MWNVEHLQGIAKLPAAWATSPYLEALARYPPTTVDSCPIAKFIDPPATVALFAVAQLLYPPPTVE